MMELYPLLGICPKDSTDSCSAIFIAALSTIARKWKWPECSSADEQVVKMVVCSVEFKEIGKREIVGKWMDLEKITLCEVTQAQKGKQWFLSPNPQI